MAPARLFVEELGRSPSRFYLELRLKRARRMLLQSADPVLEIALKCGLANASHVGRCYREVFRDTPAKFWRTRRAS